MNEDEVLITHLSQTAAIARRNEMSDQKIARTFLFVAFFEAFHAFEKEEEAMAFIRECLHEASVPVREHKKKEAKK